MIPPNCPCARNVALLDPPDPADIPALTDRIARAAWALAQRGDVPALRALDAFAEKMVHEPLVPCGGPIPQIATVQAITLPTRQPSAAPPVWAVQAPRPIFDELAFLDEFFNEEWSAPRPPTPVNVKPFVPLTVCPGDLSLCAPPSTASSRTLVASSSTTSLVNSAVRRKQRLLPSAQLVDEVRALRDSLPDNSFLVPRLQAALMSWEGVGNAEILGGLGVNHDLLWRTKRCLLDEGVSGYMREPKRSTISSASTSPAKLPELLHATQ